VGDTPKKGAVEIATSLIKTPGHTRRMAAFVTVGTAVQVFVFSAISFISLLVTDEFKGPVWLASLILAVPHFAGLWAGVVGGHISDKIGKMPVMLTVSLAAGPIIYLLSLGTSWWLLPIVLLAMGICMYVAMPVSEAYVISHASPRNRSTILGVYYFASRGGPGILTPIIGKLADQYSFGTAFAAVGVGLLAIALVCAVPLWGSKD
jgi:MFS family permease